MQTASLTPSKILFYFCIFFILGILIESVLNLSQILVCGFLLVGIIFIFVGFLNKNIKIIFGFYILFLAIGILRVQVIEFNIENNKFRQQNGKEFVVIGKISSEPDVRDNYQRFKVNVSNSTILVTAKKYPEYNYLDLVKISGKLETPQETEDFSYKNYLMKDGIYSVMFFPEINKTEEVGYIQINIFEKIYEKILILKQKLRKSIQYSFSPPESSILEGTILGDNGAMSEDLKIKLNTTGLRHIIAVSGTHVVILSSIILTLFIGFGFKRTSAFYFAILFIIFYITLTGFPASGVRAGIMGGLYLLAQKLGRQSIGIRVVVLACATMLILNPMLLVYDIGFQLSFLAVIGLIYLEPPLGILIKRITKNRGGEFIKMISATFAAQIFTLPIIIYSFGNVSLVSPITNLLVLPIVYWLMIFGFIFSFLGIFYLQLGWIFSIPCFFILKYFLWVINVFSQIWEIKTFENVHWIWLVVLYLPIILLVKYLNKRIVEKF